MERTGDLLIRLEKVDLGYDGPPILTGVDLEIHRGDYLGVVGPNGAGKSTLLLALLDVLTPLSGTVERPARVRFGYVPQRGLLDDVFPLSVADVVRMGLDLTGQTDARGDRIESVLAEVGLAGLTHHRFSELSGGQRQRVLLARALAMEPELLILDEPTNGLDLRSEASLMGVFDALHGSGLTVILVTHLLGLVANHARTLALVEGGTVVSGPIERLLTADHLETVYRCPVRVVDVDGQRVVLPLEPRPRGGSRREYGQGGDRS
ncbi:MAG: ATP-binding cassette domain-containing protein [Candidatus Riflebacteria bacterium]|nr:ATP-binding cassette domain-containing protein [Candidatus Riflebacteria bacterium]